MKKAYYTRSPRTPLEYVFPIVFSAKTLKELRPKERKQFKPKQG